MNQKLLTKVIATTLAVILTFANFIMLGVYAGKTYATNETLENQATQISDGNIEFDAYFPIQNGGKTHAITSDFDNQEAKINLSVNVKKGYLKNARIEMHDENNNATNFKIANADNILDTVESVDIQNNIVALKQVDSGTQINLQLPIVSLKDNVFDLSNLSKINKIKLIGSYVNNEGKTIDVQKEIQVKVEWTKSEIKPILTEEVKAYIPYTLQEKSETMLQTIIKTGIGNNALPVKKTTVQIKVPEANGVKPEKVIVTANSTYGTNNLSQENFNENNYTYDATTGILTINVENTLTDNKVSWNKNVQDEYVVTYIYNGKLETLTTTETTAVQIEAYNTVETKAQTSNELNIEETGIKGNFIEVNKSATEALSKGYLYTKSERETSYNEKLDLTIGYKEVIDKAVVNTSIDNFINAEGAVSPTTISNINYAYYKTTTINKAKFEKILGTEGYIKINKISGENLITINKDTTPDENGNYTYVYTEEMNQIQIETSKPVAEGIIEIRNEKALKGQTDYSKQQIQTFQKLQLKTTATAIYANTKIAIAEGTNDISLVDPTTKVELSVNKQDLSTIVKNENVEIKAILKTNDISCDLYKNPVVEMVLPNYIKELNIKSVNLLYDEELQIEEYKSYVNGTGNIVIRVVLKGEDTKYNYDQITKGANIIINTDITLKQLTPTTQDVVRVYVTNEQATSYENAEGTTSPLNAVAPVGLVTTNQISGYNEANESIMSISGDVQTGKLDIQKQARQATVSMNIINNYSNAIKNVVVLGRIPFKGNKDVITGKDLDSNLTTTLARFNAPEGATVYYSENPNATKDLDDASNGWTNQITQETKSYLVVLGNSEMQTGTKVDLSYVINIPENLNHNLQTYATYGVYFENVPKVRTYSLKAVSISDQTPATIAGLSTGAGPELEVNITNSYNNVQEGQYITYEVTVKNVGTTSVSNIVVKGSIPEGTIYVYEEGMYGTEDALEDIEDGNTKEYTETISKINPNEEMSVLYRVKALPLDRDGESNVIGRTITASASATVGNDVFNSNNMTNNIIEGQVYTTLTLEPEGIGFDRLEGDEFQYALDITNPTSKEIKNVTVTYVIPDGLTFVGISEEGTYDANSRTATWQINEIGQNSYEKVTINVKTSALGNDEYSKTITSKMNVNIGNNNIETEEEYVNVAKPGLSISQTCDIKTSTISVGETLNYTVTVKNTGKAPANNAVIEDKIPEGLKYEGASYTYNGQTYTSKMEGNLKALVTLPQLKPDESIDVVLTMIVDELNEGETQRNITNEVKVKGDNVSETEGNKISHTIVSKGGTTNDPTTGEIQEGTYRITGLAWFDANEDGKYDEDEKTLENIKVMLIDAASGKIVKDIVTGKDKNITTDENGTYTFANLKAGKYMVVYVYDEDRYVLTTYKKDGVAETVNSDVTSIKINLNGETINAAATDTLEITDSNINNINMGLIEAKKFDLKLDKTVSKITVTDSKGTKVNEAKNQKLAKIDLDPKTINTANVVIEYKITVTNEGQIPGYAKKIVDYLPKELKFQSELNQEWYQAEDGNAYNASLANTLINPGESKEVTLVLTKKMTENDTGNINNVAEIYEASNDFGLRDANSIPANKVQDENDISSADVILGIKTGEIYVYILITLISVGLLGAGMYFIKKKVLNNI